VVGGRHIRGEGSKWRGGEKKCRHGSGEDQVTKRGPSMNVTEKKIASQDGVVCNVKNAVGSGFDFQAIGGKMKKTQSEGPAGGGGGVKWTTKMHHISWALWKPDRASSRKDGEDTRDRQL